MREWFGNDLVVQWIGLLLLGVLGIGGAWGSWWIGVKANESTWRDGDTTQIAYSGGSRGGAEGSMIFGFFALFCAGYVLIGWIPWAIWLVKKTAGWE